MKAYRTSYVMFAQCVHNIRIVTLKSVGICAELDVGPDADANWECCRLCTCKYGLWPHSSFQ